MELSRGKKYLLLTLLYFSQGIPYGLFAQAIPVVLRQSDASLKIIGLSSILAFPWALKFLWAPWLDRAPFWSPHRRKGWLIPLQLVTAAALIGLGFLDPWSQLGLVVFGIVVVNLLNASQDVATDGLAVDLLTPDERGVGNGIQVGGYRLGMLFGGAFVLIVVDLYGWLVGLSLCSLALVLAILPIFGLTEPTTHAGGERVRWSVLVDFLKTPGAKLMLFVIVTFKLGDAMASGMVRPMLVDQGLTMADIGAIMGGVGFTAAFAGTAAGALLADRLARSTALFAGTVFQVVGAILYLSVVGGGTYTAIAIVVSVENFLGSIATVILFTCMMDWCRKENSGADYTMLAAAAVWVQGVGMGISGFTATGLGYAGHHVLSGVLAAIGGSLAAWAVLRRERQFS